MLITIIGDPDQVAGYKIILRVGDPYGNNFIQYPIIRFRILIVNPTLIKKTH